MCKCVFHFGDWWWSGGGSKKNLESLLRDSKFLGKAKLCVILIGFSVMPRSYSLSS